MDKKKLAGYAIAFIVLLFGACDFGNHDNKNVTGPVKRRFYSEDLQAWLDSSADTDSVEIVIGLMDKTAGMGANDPGSFTRIEVTNGVVKEYDESGVLVPNAELAERAVWINESLRDKAESIANIRHETATLLATRLQLDLEDKKLKLNNIATVVRGEMTKEQILDLAEHMDLVDGVELVTADVPNLANALVDTKVSTVAHPKGYDGSNIGIYIHEASNNTSYDKDSPFINQARFNRLSRIIHPDPTPKQILHATQMIITAQTFAPDAMVYFGKYTILDNPAAENPPVYIYNKSWNKSNGSSEYSIETRDLDNHVYNKKIALFCSSGNEGDNVTHPGAAYNAITVGGYDSATNSLKDKANNYINPETDCEKPELIAPGWNIEIGNYMPAIGSSTSSSMTSGLAACMMESFDVFKNKPHLVKACMMAGAVNRINEDKEISDIFGTGSIDFERSTDSWSGWEWDKPNNGVFDTNEKVMLASRFIKGKRYRIALTWLVNGSFAYNHKFPNMDMDLYIYKNGLKVAGSNSIKNNFEFIDFTAESTGTHNIEIKRQNNYETSSRVIMALVIVRLPLQEVEYRLASGWSGKMLTATKTENNAEVRAQPQHSDWASQDWELEYVYEGNPDVVRLKNKWSGRYLNVESDQEDAAIRCYDFVPEWDSMQWIIEFVDSNSAIRLKNVWTGRYLTVRDEGDYAEMHAQSLNTGWASQKWILK